MQLRTCTSKYHTGAPEIPLSEFSRDRSRKDGYHNHCTLCRREARKHWYIENKEEIAERTKDNILIISWRANNLKGTGTLEELVALGD